MNYDDPFVNGIAAQQKDLIRYARRLANQSVNPYKDAEDLVQDTIVKAINDRDSFDINTNMGAWLTTIMKRSHLDELRSFGRRDRLNLLEEQTIRDRSISEFIRASADPEKRMIMLEAIQRHFDMEADNRIENNQHDQTRQKNNKSGHKGVYKRTTDTWVARIYNNGKIVNLGNFKSLEDAVTAYKNAADKKICETKSKT